MSTAYILISLYFSYGIFDLQSKDMYAVDLEVSVCLDTDLPCVMTELVLNHVELPKKICNWSKGNVNPGNMAKLLKKYFSLLLIHVAHFVF